MMLIRINGDAYNVANIVSIEVAWVERPDTGRWRVRLCHTDGKRTHLTGPLTRMDAECARDDLIAAITRAAPWAYVESIKWSAP